MDFLPEFLRYVDADLKPANSEQIPIESARERLYPGAHIATSNPYEHYHHGIVVDTEPEDWTIIHLWGQEKDDSRIQKTNLPIFLAGGVDQLGKRTRQLYLVNYADDTDEKRQETVKKAKEMLEKADEVVYHITKRNCEGFAHFCRADSWKSEQIEKLRELLVLNLDRILRDVKNADGKNRKHVQALMQTIPTQPLASKEKVMYDQLMNIL